MSTKSLTSPSWIKWSFNPTIEPESDTQQSKHKTPGESQNVNATLVVLARNSEVGDVVSSMRQLEERFNHRFGYPWVFLNDVPFSEEFML